MYMYNFVCHNILPLIFIARYAILETLLINWLIHFRKWEIIFGWESTLEIGLSFNFETKNGWSGMDRDY